ncbi:hypothetical protein REH59_10665 [Pseudomonas sp. BO3-4]|uniref:hypothetical protein n=1 Tax=Pseudomonas sp. BO3-4 TaxID=3094916 RepID=UPI002A59A544|nr:hypothetical protein [Pseudomonas sp. BO3-4]WPO32079.1 hypothetical protein REH59_10665 [Pseudomonas sp. BO3-4]
MKRNKSIATRLLEYIEEYDVEGAGLFRVQLQQIFYDEHHRQYSGEGSVNLVEYHLDLLVSANFVKLIEEPSGREHDIFTLTWSGHDHLEKR